MDPLEWKARMSDHVVRPQGSEGRFSMKRKTHTLAIAVVAVATASPLSARTPIRAPEQSRPRDARPAVMPTDRAAPRPEWSSLRDQCRRLYRADPAREPRPHGEPDQERVPRGACAP